MTNSEAPKTSKQTFRGTVVSDAMQKTIVVRVTSVRWHPKYRKQYRTSKRYKVHDEANTCKTGDVVEFIPSRPFSKEKRWRLLRKVSA